MIKLTEVSGVIKGVFSNEELDRVVELMSKLDSNDPEEKANRFKPIGIGHMLYSWFEKKIFNKIVEKFEDHQKIKMTFGSYTNERMPFGYFEPGTDEEEHSTLRQLEEGKSHGA